MYVLIKNAISNQPFSPRSGHDVHSFCHLLSYGPWKPKGKIN